VIRQVWITPHFGVLSKHPGCSDEGFFFIEAVLTPPSLGCKARFSRVFQLAAVQVPVLSSPSPAPEWARSAKQVAMQQVARETWAAFERRLERAQVPLPQRPDYHKWTRFYLDFCHKYSHLNATSKPPQSVLIANRYAPQSHPKATSRLPQGHPKATPRPPQGYPKATPRLPQGYLKATPKPG